MSHTARSFPGFVWSCTLHPSSVVSSSRCSLHVPYETILGAVHKVRHAILVIFDSPLSHFVTHPGTPKKYVTVTHLGPPRFLVGLVQKTPVQILSQLFAGVLSGGFVRGCLVWKVLSGVVFVHSPFCQNTSVTTES